MGVPALFRWLSKKYPKIISPVVEQQSDSQYGQIPQYLDENPNGELDNLYLDMNGIVHPCSHPEHKPPPQTEDEMFLDVFTYTDRVLMMARPRKVLVIAVDGVAPRAKMNQQRARRFRAAQDAKVANEEKERQIKESEARGETIDDAIKGKRKWDTNAITPGTPFMDGLAAALRYWVAYKLALDPGWANLQVIISDATVPGEGEHKLMSFIRSQRLDPEYDPNTKHCIYGLDADLIFLGLATHEPHFRVLREDVFAQNSGRMRVADELLMTAEEKKAIDEQDAKKPFLWLHVNVLREYLEIELKQKMSVPWDLERAIDDWVFMCFFVGNDFLPHMPALSVRDNGIDILINCWKQVISRLSDYMTRDGKLNLEGVEQLLAAVALKEDGIFVKRYENELRYQHNDKRRRVNDEEERALRKQYLPTVSKGKEKAPLAPDANMPLMDTSGKLVEGFADFSNKDIVKNREVIQKANMANAEAAEALKKLIKTSGESRAGEGEPESQTETPGTQTEGEYTETGESGAESAAENLKRAAPEDDDDDDGSGDPVRTWEAGYRPRYYRNKFHVQTAEEINEIRKSVIRSYLEGISWVLLYYYQGCPLWQWYYPFHYAPFAADFSDLREVVGKEGISFELGQPFRPYEQLMSVLPAASGHTLPAVFRELMSSPDSEIIDFYPENFQIDMNGAKMSWQGIALLPFIDEKRLLTAVQGKYSLLTQAEVERNTNKSAQLYISSKNKNYQIFLNSFENDEEVAFKSHSTGLAGSVKPIENFSTDGELLFPLKEGEMPDIDKSTFLAAWYEFPKTFPGKSMLLNGYISHTKVLNENDYYALTSRQRYNPRFQNVSDYVNQGPSGKDEYLTYSMRPGGYRAFVKGVDHGNYRNQRNQGYPNQRNQGYNQGYQNRGSPNNRNQGYQNRGNQGYHQGNQGYNQGNQGYNQGNQGYNQGNQGYNQGNQGYNQGNQGYNQGYNQGNQGYQNQRNQNYRGNQGYNSGLYNQGQMGHLGQYGNRGNYQNQHRLSQNYQGQNQNYQGQNQNYQNQSFQNANQYRNSHSNLNYQNQGYQNQNYQNQNFQNQNFQNQNQYRDPNQNQNHQNNHNHHNQNGYSNPRRF